MKTLINRFPFFLILFMAYFIFGVFNPLKVFYLNLTVMSYINAAMLYLNSYFIEAVYFLRNI